MMQHERISLSYVGTHTAYQMALAAQEMDELKAFYCSVYDAPGKWGPRLGRLIRTGLMDGRSAPGLRLDRVTECPWPLVAKALRDRAYKRGVNHWLAVNAAFDRWAAAKIAADPPALFVGVSTSDLHSLKAARRAGALLVHDVPHLHPTIEAVLLAEAADRAGIAPSPPRRRWRRDMSDRKLAEMALADRLLTYSELHRSTYLQAGFAPERVAVTPLWAEEGMWHRDVPYAPDPDRPLRLLFVGAITLRKGIPFLLDAMRLCGGGATLTIVGPQDPQSAALLRNLPANVTVLPPQSKPVLQQTYQAHDVFVLPSVGDAFGYVALEAMACGLPVITSRNCGVTPPDPSWSVPAMDGPALAERITYYAEDRTRACVDGVAAQEYAARFTTAAYRRSVQAQFRELLGN